MKKILYAFILILIFSGTAFASTNMQFGSVSTTNSLPDIKITKPPVEETILQRKTITSGKKTFNPKGAGMTNYQYDDTYYKYNKYEKYVKDNIEYSQTGKNTVR